MVKKLTGLSLFILLMIQLKAQDTLPEFSAVNKGNNRIVISWANPYRDTIRQLSIQRSFDSLRTFKSIMTVPDPTVAQNGYVDAQAPVPTMFYRLYILLDNGRYLFSRSKRPVPDLASAHQPVPGASPSRPADPARDQIRVPEASLPRTLYIKVKETFLAQIPESYLSSFRDSIRLYTKDTLLLMPPDTILIKPFVPVEVFKASRYVFTDKDGNIKISLSDAASRKYHIRFFEEDNSPLFELKEIKEPVLLLDKVNFNHSGWFHFELYDGEKLKEKSRFFVPKDF